MTGGLFAFAYADYSARFQEGVLPVQCMFTEFEDIQGTGDWIRQSINQTWDWPEAEAAVNRARALITVTDLLAGELQRKTRLKLFHGVVQATLDHLNPLAIHWLPSQRVVNPARYKEDLANDQPYFSSAVNVRLFRVEDSEERIMDTMGLTALGVPDLQIHFSGLDPMQVGMLLYKYSEYLIERGDVVRDGHTVQGLTADDKWTCRHEYALVDPRRTVIDIQPGQYSPTR
jgi:hypothetical protein